MRVGVYPGSFNPPTVAHLTIAQAAVAHHSLDRIDFVVSEVALAKEHVDRPTLEHRIELLEILASTRHWLRVVVTDRQLLVEIAEGYDVLVMGADKYVQVHDPQYYDDSVVARDAAVARLPTLAVASRPPHQVPDHQLLQMADDLTSISSTAVRAGRHEWMPPEVRAFDERTGAWSDPRRYDRFNR